jgi:hypothetical protein
MPNIDYVYEWPSTLYTEGEMSIMETELSTAETLYMESDKASAPYAAIRVHNARKALEVARRLEQEYQDVKP